MTMCQNRSKEHLSDGCWVGYEGADFEGFLSHWLEIKKAALPVGQSRRDDFRKKLRPRIGPDLAKAKNDWRYRYKFAVPKATLLPDFLFFLYLFSFFSFKQIAIRYNTILPNRNNALLSNSNIILF